MCSRMAGVPMDSFWKHRSLAHDFGPLHNSGWLKQCPVLNTQKVQWIFDTTGKMKKRYICRSWIQNTVKTEVWTISYCLSLPSMCISKATYKNFAHIILRTEDCGSADPRRYDKIWRESAKLSISLSSQELKDDITSQEVWEKECSKVYRTQEALQHQPHLSYN